MVTIKIKNDYWNNCVHPEVAAQFYTNCKVIIETAIAHHQSYTTIRYKDMPPGLTYEDLEIVYRVLEGECFNVHHCGVHFGGFDLGSGVSIYDLTDDSRIFSRDHGEKFRAKVEKVYAECLSRIQSGDTDFSVGHVIGCATGYWFHYIYYKVSRMLEPHGFCVQYDFNSKKFRPVPFPIKEDNQ